MGGNTTKCGHLSCTFKIIGFHSIFTMHSSYLKGETDNCPTTRIAVDGEVLSYGDILITSTYLQWEPRLCPNENLGRRAHKNERGLQLLCSDWREVSDRFSWDTAEAI